MMMDSLRNSYAGDDSGAHDAPGIEPPPMIGTDERRMHVRAYNFWAKLLEGRSFPAIEALDLDDLGDFGPNTVLLDFTSGIENPAIGFVGEALARECDLDSNVGSIADIPRRSLLSRLTDHYLQIIANRAPIGFEAEFVNATGATILYRGVLLPFSSDDDTIDFILGVINWKAAADDVLTAALEAEMAAAASVPHTPRRPTVPVWADGPDADLPAQISAGDATDDDGETLDLTQTIDADAPVHDMVSAAAANADDGDDADDGAPPFEAATAQLADWLAEARREAAEAQAAHARGHSALYQALGRAAGFASAAAAAPDDYAMLLDDAGIAASPRSPMTPVVKLVFGAAHDKTRVAEYAAILGFAAAEGIAADALPAFIARHDGGIKGLVRAIRSASKTARPAVVDRLGAATASLRAAAPVAMLDLGDLTDDSEFVVMVARREADGSFALLSITGDDGVAAARLLKAAA